jgi:hypothetical protein
MLTHGRWCPGLALTRAGAVRACCDVPWRVGRARNGKLRPWCVCMPEVLVWLG